MLGPPDPARGANLLRSGAYTPFRPAGQEQSAVPRRKPALSLARQTAGMVPWTGDPETLERIVRDPEFGILESP